MNDSNQLLVFVLDGYRYALHLPVVNRIVRAVEVTPLPKAPEIVLGVINVQGSIFPVVNIRKRFRLPEREIDLDDQLILTHTSKRPIALLVDSVVGVVEYSDQDMLAARNMLPGVEYVEGVVKLEDGMVFIHDLDTFLSLEEEGSLDAALRENDKP